MINFKIIIYLNDVTEKTAPFEILYNSKTKSYPKLVPYGNTQWSWKVIDVPIDYKIELHNKFPTWKDFIETLAHEMVHLYQFQVWKDPYSNHNANFYSWKNYFKQHNLRLYQ